jgi:hypothetical protein
MTRKVFIQRLSIIAAVAVFAAVFPSWIEGRSQPGVSRQALGENLNRIPNQLGDWECISEERLQPEVERTLRCYGYINRVYWNAKTGSRVSLAILYGPRGPMAVHTPEICYSSRGRVPQGKPQEVSPRGEANGSSFWRLNFKQANEQSSDLEVWYAWSDGGDWIASSHPRFWTIDSLYKLQLAGTIGSEGQEGDCEDFIQQIVPAFRNHLNLEMN